MKEDVDDAETEVNNIYSDKVIEHFTNPKNAYRMLDANGEGALGDPACGDSLRMFIKVENNIIQKASFLVFGCCASIATSSITSVLAQGKTIEEALNITEQDIVEALDGLPEEKLHCSNLGVGALKMAIADYEEKRVKSKAQIMQIKLTNFFSSLKNKVVNYMVYRLYKR